jgi:hypothetical protein
MEKKYEIYKIKDGIFIALYDDAPNSLFNYRHGFIIYSKGNRIHHLGKVQHWSSPVSYSYGYFTWDENYVYIMTSIEGIKLADHFFDINKCDIVPIDELMKLRYKYYTSLPEYPGKIQISEEEEKKVRRILKKIK